MTPSTTLKPIKANAPKSLSKHKILSKEEIIQKGREALIIAFLYRKIGARTYQVRWIKDIIFRKDTQTYIPIVYAPTGAGKSTTMNMVFKNMSQLDEEKTITALSVPKTSQQIIVDAYDDIKYSVTDTCIIISEALSEKVVMVGDTIVVSKHSNYVEIMEQVKDYQHIIILGSHEYIDTYMIPFFNHTDICDNRNLRWFLDEAQKEMHSDGADAYEVNLELDKSHYSPHSKPMIDKMINLGFYGTGFTGTPSKQQRGQHTNNGVFIYKPLSEIELLEVALNNSYLDMVSYLKDSGPFYNASTNTKTYKAVIKSIKENVYGRDGVGIFYLSSANAAKNTGVISIDEFKYIRDGLKEETILYWFGGTEKYINVIKNIKDDKIVKTKFDSTKHYKQTIYFDVNTNIKDILNNPDLNIKLILVKGLLKDGFDYNNINSIYFGSTINKMDEFITYLQQIGRGVRIGSAGLRIGFTCYSEDFKYKAQDLIKRLLEMKVILEKNDYFRLKASFTKDYEFMMTQANCIDLVKRLDAKTYKNSLRELAKNINDVILKLTKTTYEHELELKEISTLISSALERFSGSKPNMVKTGGINAEDGFLYFPEEDKIIGYDVKVKLSSVVDSEHIKCGKNQSVNLKDKTRGDGRINNHIMYFVFDVQIVGNTIDSIDLIIVEFEKSYTDTMKSNSLSLSKLSDKSTYKTNLYTRRKETFDILDLF